MYYYALFLSLSLIMNPADTLLNWKHEAKNNNRDLDLDLVGAVR